MSLLVRGVARPSQTMIKTCHLWYLSSCLRLSPPSSRNHNLKHNIKAKSQLANYFYRDTICSIIFPGAVAQGWPQTIQHLPQGWCNREGIHNPSRTTGVIRYYDPLLWMPQKAPAPMVVGRSAKSQSTTRGDYAPIIATPHSYEISFIHFIFLFFAVSPSSAIIIHFIAAPAPWILFYLFYLFSCGGLGAGNAIIIYFIARRLGAGPFP